MESPRAVLGLPEPPTDGLSVDQPSEVRGYRIGRPWVARGLSVGCQGTVCRLPRAVHEPSVGCPRVVHEYSRVVRGLSTGVPWDFCCLSVSYPYPVYGRYADSP